MDVGIVWGIVFAAYIATSIYPLMKANNGPRPKDTIPGSLKLKMWEQNEKTGYRALIIWGLGFCVLLAAYAGYTDYEKEQLQENALATAYRSSDTTTADYIAILRATTPNNEQSGPSLAQTTISTHTTLKSSDLRSPGNIAIVFVALLAFLALVIFLSVTAWKLRSRLYNSLIYVLGRAYRISKKVSSQFTAFAEQVKEAAEK